MLNQRHRHTRRTKAEKKIEEIRAEVEKVLERLDKIEVEETWTKKWRTRSVTTRLREFSNKIKGIFS